MTLNGICWRWWFCTVTWSAHVHACARVNEAARASVATGPKKAAQHRHCEMSPSEAMWCVPKQELRHSFRCSDSFCPLKKSSWRTLNHSPQLKTVPWTLSERKCSLSRPVFAQCSCIGDTLCDLQAVDLSVAQWWPADRCERISWVGPPPFYICVSSPGKEKEICMRMIHSSNRMNCLRKDFLTDSGWFQSMFPRRCHLMRTFNSWQLTRFVYKRVCSSKKHTTTSSFHGEPGSSSRRGHGSDGRVRTLKIWACPISLVVLKREMLWSRKWNFWNKRKVRNGSGICMSCLCGPRWEYCVRAVQITRNENPPWYNWISQHHHDSKETWENT